MQYYVAPEITTSTDFDNDSLGYYNYFTVNISSNATITLPTSVWDGLVYSIIRKDSNILVNLTINAHTGTINGGSSTNVAASTYAECVYYSGNWTIAKDSVTF